MATCRVQVFTHIHLRQSKRHPATLMSKFTKIYIRYNNGHLPTPRLWSTRIRPKPNRSLLAAFLSRVYQVCSLVAIIQLHKPHNSSHPGISRAMTK